MLGDVFIECNKMDNDKDGKAIVAPTAQSTNTKSHTRKPSRKNPEFEPHGESYGESHWKCSRSGKNKNDASTPEKTKKTSTKKQDKTTNRANAECVLDPNGSQRMYGRNYHRENTSWKIRGCDPSSIARKEASKIADKKEWVKEINRRQ